MRRHVCRHADRDASSAVDEEIRERRRENGGLGPGFVVVRDEIDRVLIHVDHERRAEMRHPRLGVTHRRRRIAFHRTEIALAVDQRLAHRPGLRHVNERRVNHRFAVGVIVTARVAANLRAFPVLPVREQRQIVHRIKDAPLRWLQSVPRVRQRPRDDDRHGVVEERSRNFLGYIDRLYFFVGVIHGGKMTNDECRMTKE